MPSIITKQAARIVFDKVESSTVPIAVFVSNGAVKSHKAGTQNCERRMGIEPENLVAIYTIETRLQWIESDLEAAGIK